LHAHQLGNGIALVELVAGAQGWAVFFAALAVFSAWRFAVIDYTNEDGGE